MKARRIVSAGWLVALALLVSWPSSLVAEETGEWSRAANEGSEVFFSPSHAGPDPLVREWKAGEYVYCHVQKKSPLPEYLFADEMGAQDFWLALFREKNLLGYYSWQLQRSELSASRPGSLSAPIISDPGDRTLHYFNTVFPDLLSALPDGEHRLSIQVGARNAVNDAECLARGTLKVRIDAAARRFLKANSEASYRANLERGGVVVRGGIQVHGPEGYELSIAGSEMRAGAKSLFLEKGQTWLHTLWPSGKIFGSAYNDARSANRLFTVTRNGGNYEVHEGYEMHPVMFSITTAGEVRKGGALWASIDGNDFNPGDEEQIVRIAIGLFHLSDIRSWQAPASAARAAPGRGDAPAPEGAPIAFKVKNCGPELWSLRIVEESSGKTIKTMPLKSGEILEVKASEGHMLLGGSASSGAADPICPFVPSLIGKTLELDVRG